MRRSKEENWAGLSWRTSLSNMEGPRLIRKDERALDIMEEWVAAFPLWMFVHMSGCLYI